MVASLAATHSLISAVQIEIPSQLIEAGVTSRNGNFTTLRISARSQWPISAIFGNRVLIPGIVSGQIDV